MQGLTLIIAALALSFFLGTQTAVAFDDQIATPHEQQQLEQIDADSLTPMQNMPEQRASLRRETGCKGCCSNYGYEDWFCQKRDDQCQRHPKRCVRK